MKPMYLHTSNAGHPPKIQRQYDRKFRATAAHRASLDQQWLLSYSKKLGISQERDRFVHHPTFS